MKKAVFIFALFFGLIIPVLAWTNDQDILAKIGPKEITRADFEQFINSFTPEQKQFLSENPKQKEILLDRLVQVQVVSDLARRKNLDKDDRVKMQIENQTNEILAQEFLRRELEAEISITEEDLNIYYLNHQKEFDSPEMVRVRHILIKIDKDASDQDRQKAREKAESLLSRINNGEDFAKLASEYSDDPNSKVKGGDLGFIQRGKVIKPFEEAAFSLKPGEVSPVIETILGFHILKLEKKKPAGIEPLEKVKNRIRAKVLEDLKNAKRKSFIEKVLKEAKVEIHPELLVSDKK
jgi:peptidyl-prolyl cis-trans isomerase C